MEEIKKIIDEHEARSVSVTGLWYERDSACAAIIHNARRRGFFYMGDVIKILNIRCKALGFPGSFTSRSNPIGVAAWRGMVKGKMADNQAIWELDIESTLEYLRQYKPRRREERS